MVVEVKIVHRSGSVDGSKRNKFKEDEKDPSRKCMEEEDVDDRGKKVDVSVFPR